MLSPLRWRQCQAQRSPRRPKRVADLSNLKLRRRWLQRGEVVVVGRDRLVTRSQSEAFTSFRVLSFHTLPFNWHAFHTLPFENSRTFSKILEFSKTALTETTTPRSCVGKTWWSHRPGKLASEESQAKEVSPRTLKNRLKNRRKNQRVRTSSRKSIGTRGESNQALKTDHAHWVRWS